MRRGLILYGPPASGKDSVTLELVSRRSRFEHFKRLKCGPGRTAGYRMLHEDQANELRKVPGAILWENRRYGATYFVDRSGLDQIWASCRVPIVHLGQIEAVDAVVGGIDADWTVAELFARPEVLGKRIQSRGTGDEDERFAAVEQTPRLPAADVRIDTGALSIREAADAIERHMGDRP